MTRAQRLGVIILSATLLLSACDMAGGSPSAPKTAPTQPTSPLEITPTGSYPAPQGEPTPAGYPAPQGEPTPAGYPAPTTAP